MIIEPPDLNRKQRNWGFLTGLLLCFIPLIIIEWWVLKRTGGVFMYPVDDVFIHLELALNLAKSGTWGINPGEFSPASSSIFYTLLLGFFSFLSDSILWPFIINVVAAICLLFVFSNWLARQNISLTRHLLIVAAVVLLTPLPVLVLSGMEHTLQCLFSFLFLVHFTEWLSVQKSNEPVGNIPWKVLLFGILVTATRYEGIFLVAMACASLLYYRKWYQSILLGLISALPVLLFGLISVLKGSYFFPNSVLIKSDEVPLFGGGPGHLVQTLLVEKLTLMKPGITALATQRLLLILPLSYLLFRQTLQGKKPLALQLLLLTGTTLLHLALASTGKFYRYEAYLIFCSMGAVGLTLAISLGSLKSFRPKVITVLASLLFFFLLFPLALRSSAAFSKAGQACINIFEQQYQMGKFLQNYYHNSPVAANDIGAVSYYTKGTIIDLWGLGSNEIARSRKDGSWTPAFLDSFSKKNNVGLAIIYDSWFNNGLQPYWKKVATWQVPDNVVLGDETVSFYAVDSTGSEEIRRNLMDFQKQLPVAVKVRYY
jgi:hypothetical protein